MFTTSGRKPTRYQLEHDGGYDVPATLTGTLQLTDRSANVQVLVPGAVDREVRMPESNRANVPFRIVHVGSANNLLLRTSTGASVSGAGPGGGVDQLTPGQQCTCVYVEDAGASGWIHLGITAITL